MLWTLEICFRCCLWELVTLIQLRWKRLSFWEMVNFCNERYCSCLFVCFFIFLFFCLFVYLCVCLVIFSAMSSDSNWLVDWFVVRFLSVVITTLISDDVKTVHVILVSTLYLAWEQDACGGLIKWLCYQTERCAYGRIITLHQSCYV